MKMLHFGNIIVLIAMSFLTSGCWDRIELNNRALVMASGIDLKDDGSLLLTDQVILPINLSKGLGTLRQQFITVSATGRNILDAGQNMQAKLSRKYFLGHRRIIFIGEKLAKHGLSGIMDEFTRNPDVRLRSDVFVVENGTAEHALHIRSPLEQYPSLAIMKSRKFVGGDIGTTLLPFLMASVHPTSSPTFPVMKIVPESPHSNKTTFQFMGRAVFNKQLKLIGYLNYSEAAYRLWVLNTLSTYQATFKLNTDKDSAKGKGYATIDFSKFHSRINPVFQNGRLHYVVNLTGKGILRESENNIKFKSPEDINLVEKKAEKEVKWRVNDLIAKVQHQYHTDIFGFDLALARKYPRQWKTAKRHWTEIFSDVPVQVNTRIKIQAVGQTSESIVSPKEAERGQW
ncbi:Ger(x)C family spore germination protein [Alicyclobacillus sp. SO9]|uniref:Ger(x)C family spore germination protein n=1 Tax=Alicyclobacillus sp. SO9 TaxID=2665646 RepID=UPI0018E8BC54|nr:Ger(x)C family spore germination protein [Alicyclobacillus sp. SO9]QQE79694.1 Ger(x)C family spore germination protein [Alicyclobacillus sp. SO9]